MDECASAACSVNGTANCTDLIDAYECRCLPGFNGTYCESGKSFFYSNSVILKLNVLFLVFQPLSKKMVS